MLKTSPILKEKREDPRIHTGAGEPARPSLHLLEWPSGKFELTGMKTSPSKIYLLADPQRKPMVVTNDNGRLTVDLPETAPGKPINVPCV